MGPEDPEEVTFLAVFVCEPSVSERDPRRVEMTSFYLYFTLHSGQDEEEGSSVLSYRKGIRGPRQDGHARGVCGVVVWSVSSSVR